MRALTANGTLRRVCAGAFVFLTACGDLLKVSNPSSLGDDALADPALEQFVINGAIGEFQAAYVNYVFWSAVLSDEAYTDHPNVGFREIGLHRFTHTNATNDSVYKTLQRARQAADDAVGRIKAMKGNGASTQLNIARALAYGAYTYVLLGEGFCSAPVNVGPALPPAELFARALARFDEAITIATVGGSGLEAAARDVLYLAQVGAARAALRRGELARARAYASAVPDTYEHLAYYSANSSREYNSLQLAARAASPWLGMSPAFQVWGDARTPFPPTARPSLTSNPIRPPFKPSMYSGWNPQVPGLIEEGTHIRFATGLEARYIGLEADTPNNAMLAFVNARRATTGRPPVVLSGDALLGEFRVQRALDFYLTGQRLGDLRRYLDAGSDLFPAGKYPVLPDLYGDMHCFIIPASEKAGNPNL